MGKMGRTGKMQRAKLGNSSAARLNSSEPTSQQGLPPQFTVKAELKVLKKCSGGIRAKYTPPIPSQVHPTPSSHHRHPQPHTPHLLSLHPTPPLSPPCKEQPVPSVRIHARARVQDPQTPSARQVYALPVHRSHSIQFRFFPFLPHPRIHCTTPHLLMKINVKISADGPT